MRYINYYIIFLTISLISFYGCQKDSKTSWNTDVVFPLIHSELGINQLVNDSLLNENEDQSIELIFENELFNYNVENLLALPLLEFEKLFSVDSLRLSNTNIVYDITLGQIFRSIGGVEGFLMLAAHGQTIPIDSINNMSTDPIEINANEYFQSADLTSGKMRVAIENNLPVDIQNVAYVFKNKISQEIIATDTFFEIKSGETQADTFDLSGKTLEGDLEVQMINFDSPGSRNEAIEIDTNAVISIYLNLFEIGVNEATAVFPAQYLINDHNEVEIEDLQQQLTEITIKKGVFITEIANTAADTMYIFYDFPGVTKDGKSLSAYLVLPPPENGEAYTERTTRDLSGYHFDLTGDDGQKVNTFSSVFTAEIDSNGRIIHLTKKDSFYMYLGFEELTPESIVGSMGTDTISAGLILAPFDVFKNVTTGNVEFEDLTVELAIENSMGIEGDIAIKQIEGQGLRENIQLLSNQLNNPLRIEPATTSPLTTTRSKFTLTKDNSNIIDLINVNPRNILHDIELVINPSDSTQENFVLKESNIAGSLNITMPLSFIANDLSFRDTVALDFSKVPDQEKIKEVTLRLVIKNSFPINAALAIELLDENFESLSIIDVSNTIDAGEIVGEKVLEETISNIELHFDAIQLEKLFLSKQLQLDVTFNSQPNESLIKIFSSYQFDVTIVADFKYQK